MLDDLSLSGHSKLKEDADIKPVKTKEKLKRYQVGDDVICFVSKVSLNKSKLKLSNLLYRMCETCLVVVLVVLNVYFFLSTFQRGSVWK